MQDSSVYTMEISIEFFTVYIFPVAVAVAVQQNSLVTSLQPLQHFHPGIVIFQWNAGGYSLFIVAVSEN